MLIGQLRETQAALGKLVLVLKSSQGDKFVAHLYQSRHERSEKTEDVGQILANVPTPNPWF